MLSMDRIRGDMESAQAALLRRGEEPALDHLVQLDTSRRSLITERDVLRAQNNELSKQFGRLKGKSNEDSPDQGLEKLHQEIQNLNAQIEKLESDSSSVEKKLQELLLSLPNIPLETVPDGLDESSNIVVRQWEKPRAFNFELLPHWELGKISESIDFERGTKLSGSRFYVLRNQGARLERALVNWMLDQHTLKNGYIEIRPPILVREQMLVGSGNLPKFGDNLYRDIEEDLWLIPTAEVPLTNLHRDEILQGSDLPIYYVASTPCFRREKTAAGRDTRGIKRVHQFDKVEMYKFVTPERSSDELESLVQNAETLCRELGLTYRVLQLCAGDLGFPSAMTYDIEVWAPGSAEWLEVSSCSTCTDFQARRANIRYRPVPGDRPQFVHTLNGSGLALPRVLIAIMENYQMEDGSIAVPEVLQSYTGFKKIDAVDN
ncbi:serine--tRNA ligase [SAR202 cluster bacterium AD-802-E10_MRT_200m]|nr:serine--tRNA ligase [SAR202 cluster bacterium AD-802-E10_MRT_200m]